MLASFLSALRIALRSVYRSKLRAFLTVLGILIGVAAVVIVTALGTGVQDQVVRAIQSLGTNTILVINRPTQRSGARGRGGATGRLSEADGAAILREATSVAAIAPMISASAQLVAGDRNTNTAVIGTTVDYGCIAPARVPGPCPLPCPFPFPTRRAGAQARRPSVSAFFKG